MYLNNTEKIMRTKFGITRKILFSTKNIIDEKRLILHKKPYSHLSKLHFILF